MARAPQPDVLVAIPCLNEEATLGGVLDGLLADPLGDRMLIVVADGGSTDRTIGVAEDYADAHPGRVVWIDNPGRVQSAGVNAIVERFGEGRTWLIRVDAHCYYPEAYVSRLIGSAQRIGADSVVVPMASDGESCLQRAVAYAQNSRFGTGGSLHRHPGLSLWVDHGHHALFRLAKFRAIGGYDASFSHNEDAELDVRLGRAGGKIWLDGELAITYLPRKRLGPLFRQYFAYGKGRARNILAHRLVPKTRQLLPLAVPPALMLALLAPLWPWTAAPAALWALASFALGGVIALRRRSICGLGSGPAFMAMHAGWALGFWTQVIGSFFRRPPPGLFLKPTSDHSPISDKAADPIPLRLRADGPRPRGARP